MQILEQHTKFDPGGNTWVNCWVLWLWRRI